jgi:hypothetical protein
MGQFLAVESLDIYSKIVLTVIAASLSVILLQNMGVVPAVQKVVICSPASKDYCAEVSGGYLQVSAEKYYRECVRI